MKNLALDVQVDLKIHVCPLLLTFLWSAIVCSFIFRVVCPTENRLYFFQSKFNRSKGLFMYLWNRFLGIRLCMI